MASPSSPPGADGLPSSPQATTAQPNETAAMNGANSAMSKQSESVLYSDIGINVLLGRLKQSIASARDFSVFLKERSILEEKHAQGLRKISRINHETAHKSESRSGSYALQLQEVTRSHERMADNGMRFSEALHNMHEDLNELCNNMERGRKHWKVEGLNNEKKVKDAEMLMDKARARYHASAESYDRARTGDSSGRSFGIKGPKSAEQREEDLQRKMQAADSEYAAKVQAAQGTRQENMTQLRPQAVKAMQELIFECDSALTLQLQKFASSNERLLVTNGLVVSPVRAPEEAAAATQLSMREMIGRINNEKDFHTYVTSHASSVPARPVEIRYEKHPTQGHTQPPSQPPVPPVTSQTPSEPQQQQSTPASAHAPVPSFSHGAPSQPTSQQSSMNSRVPNQPPAQQPSMSSSINSRAPSQPHVQTSGLPNQGYHPSGQQIPDRTYESPSAQQSFSPSGPPPQQAAPRQPASTPSSAQNPGGYSAYKAPGSAGGYSTGPPSAGAGRSDHRSPGPNGAAGLPPPYNRVFGLTLDELFKRDDTAVPMVVYRCIEAVDLFGLEVEGIYRTSGNSAHMQQLRAAFDHDSSTVDLRDPSTFQHDVNSVAGLLKHFFRDLRDPLLTLEHYDEFIDAARIEDDTLRRDNLHAVINSLPDPNYATLRALSLHLYRVQEHANANRMTTHSLAICFAPTLMGQHTGPQMADAGLQARVVDTILQNTYQIFDEDP